MNLIQKIKSLFMRNRTKKLVENNLPQKEKTDNYNKESLIATLQKDVLKEDDTNISKSDRIKEILKSVGCKKEVFIRVDDFDSIDLDNLTKVISELNKFKLSKHQFNVVFGQNINILKTRHSVIERNIGDLIDYINNPKVVKNIIYTNPYILTTTLKNKINTIKEIFNEIGFSYEEQMVILDENSNVLSLNNSVLKKSIDVVYEYCKSKEHAKEIMLENPIVIGITDINVLKNYE